jgi:hypothetical protein
MEDAMALWRTLRKTGSHVHVSYASTFSNNLLASDFQLRLSPEFELKLNLNSNLRTRSKSSNSYIDARELADGAISSLELVQIDEDQVISGLARALQSLEKQPDKWKLTILLEGEHHFLVEPEVRRQENMTSLFLRVR